MPSSSPLGRQPVVAELVRAGLVESVHHGSAVVLEADGRLAYSVGDPSQPIYPRSASKPIQALAMLRNGLDLDGKLLALAAASHSGEQFHVDGARQILAGAGLDESALQCPPALPMERDDLIAYVRAGGAPDTAHMNCSGKHSAMLATCVANGWPTESYLDPGHPLQQAILATAEELTGERIEHVAVDGCGAPLFGFSLIGLARAFGAIAGAPAGTLENRIAEAYRAYPEWVSGTQRDEYDLARALPGLMVKGGAEAVLATAFPDGRALTLKIADGNHRACMPVAVAVLRSIGIDAPTLDELAVVPVYGGGRHERAGEIRAALP
jgi:L-asparaginase II